MRTQLVQAVGTALASLVVLPFALLVALATFLLVQAL